MEKHQKSRAIWLEQENSGNISWKQYTAVITCHLINQNTFPQRVFSAFRQHGLRLWLRLQLLNLNIFNISTASQFTKSNSSFSITLGKWLSLLRRWNLPLIKFRNKVASLLKKIVRIKLYNTQTTVDNKRLKVSILFTSSVLNWPFKLFVSFLHVRIKKLSIPSFENLFLNYLASCKFFSKQPSKNNNTVNEAANKFTD